MIRRTLFATLAAVAFAAVGIPQTASATTIMQTTEAERIEMADLIVRGQVIEMWTEQGERGRVKTRVMVEPTTVLKGQAPDGPIIITQAGGTLSGHHSLIEGSARYNVGEEVLLLLEHKERFGTYVTISLAYGKYSVRLDPYTRREVAQLSIVPGHVKYDHRFLPFPAEENKLFVDDLETKISDIVAGRFQAEVAQ